jgi:deoxyribonuclease-4
VAAALDRVLTDAADDGGEVWLEITAGQGSCLGHRFEHLGDVLGAVREARRIGVCFDTCHAVAAGYRLDAPEPYAAAWEEFDRCIGLDRLRCFHLNDSQREAGSRVDRHTHIGRGHVGREAFRRIVTDPRFTELPMILETPKGSDPRGRDYDRINLAALRRLAGGRAGRARRRAIVRA